MYHARKNYIWIFVGNQKRGIFPFKVCSFMRKIIEEDDNMRKIIGRSSMKPCEKYYIWIFGENQRKGESTPKVDLLMMKIIEEDYYMKSIIDRSSMKSSQEKNIFESSEVIREEVKPPSRWICLPGR